MTVSSPSESESTPSRLSGLSALLPGLLACGGVAALAYGLRLLPGVARFSPMIIAILIGIAIRNIWGAHARLAPGIGFAMRRLLRAAIVLLGLQLTVAQVAETGIRGVLVILACVCGTFLFTLAAGRLLRVDRQLAQLIAAGTSICGASAVVAANSVTGAEDEDVAYAVACVTVFGSIAMFAYPLVQNLVALTPRDFGLWSGASIHEIAQVVAATFAVGSDAGRFGTVAKLTRVMTLAPVVFAMAAVALRSADAAGVRSGARPPMPWFVLGFIALVGVASVVELPAAVKSDFNQLSTAMLTMALAAMGLETSFVKLRAKGLRPALLGALASLFIASLSLTLIKLT